MTYTYIDPDLEEIMIDLSEFSKISIEEVRELVIQRQPYCYKREFVHELSIYDREHENKYLLINNAHQEYFYISSGYTIFGNAKHSTYINDTTKLVELISKEKNKLAFFEFGGGCGQLSLALKKKYPDIDVFFNEISSVQKDFFLFRCAKNNVSASIIQNWDFNKELPKFDVVIALDVFEHIANYPKYAKRICDSIYNNGYLWEGSYFLENIANDPTHCVEDKYNLHGIIRSSGFEKVENVKLSEGNLWRKNVS